MQCSTQLPCKNRAACFSETTHTKSKNNVNMYSFTVRLCAKKMLRSLKKKCTKGVILIYNMYRVIKTGIVFCKTEFQGDTSLFGEND